MSIFTAVYFAPVAFITDIMLTFPLSFDIKIYYSFVYGDNCKNVSSVVSRLTSCSGKLSFLGKGF